MGTYAMVQRYKELWNEDPTQLRYEVAEQHAFEEEMLERELKQMGYDLDKIREQ